GGRVEAFLAQVEGLLHERERDVDRREQPDAVVEESRGEEDEAILQAGQLDRTREFHVRLLRPPILHELERPHRTDPADLAHAVVTVEDLVQPLPDERLQLLRLRKRLLNHIDRLERRGADDGIAADRAPEAPGSRWI